MRRLLRRLGPMLVLAAVLGSVYAAAPAKRAEKPTTYEGKVVRLADLVAKTGGKLDADASPHWLALVTAEGRVYPLVKDGGARLFFLDEALLDRPMRIEARPLPGSTLLRVMTVRSVVKGQACEVYYWCDVCSIRRGEKMICECCGAKMDLVEQPLRE